MSKVKILEKDGGELQQGSYFLKVKILLQMLEFLKWKLGKGVWEICEYYLILVQSRLFEEG